MKEGAEAEAKKLGAKLLTAAGKQDGDTATQIAAIENMVLPVVEQESVRKE